MPKEKFWMGLPPVKCDLCGRRFGTDLSPDSHVEVFVDGRTQMGPWANMCKGCHRTHGVGLGMGKGQKYAQTHDGRYLKIGG